MSGKKPDLPVLAFDSKEAFEEWLNENHASSAGIWLKFAKKQSAVSSVSYPEAVETSLCYGWIDGQKKGFDEKYWLQRFTPRGIKSIWSKINKEKAEQLIADGKMRKAGFKAIEAAKQHGQWDMAYESQRTVTVPDDLQTQLDLHKHAGAFFKSLDSANRYAVLFRINTAKTPEMRAKKISTLVAMLERGEKIH